MGATIDVQRIELDREHTRRLLARARELDASSNTTERAVGQALFAEVAKRAQATTMELERASPASREVGLILAGRKT
jgi:hypothetical protein